MATYGLGGGLAGMAQQNKAEATQMLAATAQQDMQREMTNKQLGQQAKAGNAQLGSTLGAVAGMALTGGNPMGAALGSLVGGLAGGLF